jgi:SAM-dependent methyltransferase
MDSGLKTHIGKAEPNVRNMSDWVKKLFIGRSDLFLKFLDLRWPRTEELVNGMPKILGNYGISSGSLLDLCCGNGQLSIHMAMKGFKTVGVDISKPFLENARTKAEQHGVSDRTTFLQGDVRKLKKVVRNVSEPFDVVVNVWTSIGYTSKDDDLNIFEQARELSRQGAILFIAETMHAEYLSVKFTPTSYTELDNILMLEDRKYDPTTSNLSTSWIFYNKRGQNLRFLDRVDFENHIYSLSELSSLLRKARWETIASYGNLYIAADGPADKPKHSGKSSVSNLYNCHAERHTSRAASSLSVFAESEVYISVCTR